MDDDPRTMELSRSIRDDMDRDTFQGKYDASIRKKILFIILMVVVSLVALLLSVCLGAVDIPFDDLIKVFLHPIFPDWIGEPSRDYYSDFVFRGRMPRAALVVLTGMALGVAGMMMQAMLRNPLVSPFTLGVSTASAFGAALAIILGNTILGVEMMNTNFRIFGDVFSVSDIAKVIMSFALGMLSIILIMKLGRKRNQTRSTVILAGVVISYLFQAGIMSAKFLSDDSQLREITNWIMGSMANSSWGVILVVSPFVIICLLLLFKESMDLNALSAGDDVAASLGVDVNELKKRGLFLCTLMTSVCLAFTGVIGFIGLMAPHICRMIIGNDARFLMPASGLMGVTILSVSDLFCRMIIRPEELPTGIVLYVIGGLFFIWIISSSKWQARL